MAKLIYSAILSLDGYIADEEGNFEWGVPDEEVHAFINDLERQTGTYLFGRRMYEVMVAWENTEAFAKQDAVLQDFAKIWQGVEKIVYSKTLEAAASARTRIERDFDPQAVREMKRAKMRDMSVGGPELAAQAFQAGLVDECQLFILPILIGGGKHALPSGLRLRLELLEERRFGSGMVYLRYRTLA